MDQMAIICTGVVVGAITLVGLFWVLSKIYAEIEYANKLKSSDLKAKGIELPTR